MRNKLPKPLPFSDLIKNALQLPVMGPSETKSKAIEDPVLEILKGKWPELVGDRLAAKSRPSRTYGDKLVVEVPSSSWANELDYLKEKILQKLRAYPQTRRLDDIRFQVATRSSATIGFKTKPLKSFG